MNNTETVYRIDLEKHTRFSMSFIDAVAEIASTVGADRFPTRISIAFALARGTAIERFSRGVIRYVYTIDGALSANDAGFCTRAK